MNDRSATRKHGGSDSADSAAVKLDFDHMVDRADTLGAETDEQRASTAGISLSTWIRIRQGRANVKLGTLDKIAENLGTTPARLMGRIR
jgi:transcriptional regulator with XRE-family HTH domain